MQVWHDATVRGVKLACCSRPAGETASGSRCWSCSNCGGSCGERALRRRQTRLPRFAGDARTLRWYLRHV